jgi:hypothetical protein
MKSADVKTSVPMRARQRQGRQAMQFQDVEKSQQK